MSRVSISSMVSAVFLLGIVIAQTAASMTPKSSSWSFAEFTAKYGRTYASADEQAYRAAVFEANVQRMSEQSRQNPLAVFGDSPFMDLTPAEFSRQYTGLNDATVHSLLNKPFKSLPTMPKTQKPSFPPFHPHAAALGVGEVPRAPPGQWDWRPHHVVTHVKNQGDCGSCWAFSTTGNVEGQWALNRGQLVSLSEQDLISCSLSFQCNGGDTDLSWLWIELAQKGRIATEASYPYESGDGSVPACRNKAANISWGATIDGYFDISHNETEMGVVLYEHGPISIAINGTAIQGYSSGIMTSCDAGWAVDHMVLIVGYDDVHQPPYWIIKNSWGTSWGENGYFRIEKGLGLCHLNWLPATSKVAP